MASSAARSELYHSEVIKGTTTEDDYDQKNMRLYHSEVIKGTTTL